MKKLVTLMAVFVISMLSFAMVSAITGNDLQVNSIKVNGDDVLSNSVLVVEEGQKITVRVGLSALTDNVKNVEVDAKISGYKESENFESIQDSTTLFDIEKGTTKYMNLELNLPQKLDKDQYYLRLRVSDKKSASFEQDIVLKVEPKRHGVSVADVTFSPGSSIKAGKSLLATVLLENFGDKDENDVKVTVAMPELGLSNSEFVKAVKTDSNNVGYEDVPEMFLPIPATTAAGDYKVKVTVNYNNFKDTVVKEYTVKVLANEAFQTSNKLVLAVGPETQPVMAGKTATYGVALTNAGSSSKAYMVSAMAGDWATVSVSESLVVLEAGKNKVVYVEVTPNVDATAGEHVLSLSVKSGNDVLETVALKASVVAPQKAASAGSEFSLRNGLEIALVVLVVLLVIIGLIIGFSRLRKDNDEEKTYY